MISVCAVARDQLRLFEPDAGGRVVAKDVGRAGVGAVLVVEVGAGKGCVCLKLPSG